MRGAVFALAAIVALAGCAPQPSGPPHVVLVTVDTLRPDRLSAYGFRGHATPGSDRLAAEGALFENAFADSPWTTPSMASVLTGTYPTQHGFKSTNAHRLAPENVTLAERLSEAGYTTAAIIGSFPLDAIYQLDQGFTHYDDALHHADLDPSRRRGRPPRERVPQRSRGSGHVRDGGKR